MDSAKNTVKFEVTGTGMDDPLGLWASSPAPADETVHFGIGDEQPSAPPPDTPVYRIKFPDNAADAESAFRQQEARMAASAKMLDDVPNRIDALVTRTQARPQPASGEVHFGIGDESPQEDIAEADLLNLLSDADKGQPKAASEEVHFGIMEDTINPALEQAKAQFNALLEQVNREVLHFAWVETATSDKTLARTTIDWSGDAVTVWDAAISESQIELHRRTLRFATHSRALKMQMVMTIAGGAGKLSALMATPGGAVLALPVVYKYVRQIMEQVKQYQELSQ